MPSRPSIASTIVAAALLALEVGCAQRPAQQAHAAAASPATAPTLFEDVSAQAGVSFRHTNGDSFRYPILQTLGGGCAFLDYTGSGRQDILLLSCGDFPPAHTANLCLYRNLGNGAFRDVTHEAGLDTPLGYAQALAVADYDNDGYPDIFVAGYGGCHLLHNEGVQVFRRSGVQVSRSPVPGVSSPTSRHFVDVTARSNLADTDYGPRWASGAAWGDYDNDGKLDLYVCHYACWTPQTDLKCPRPDGSPGFCQPTVYRGDVARLYHNEGDGRFRDVTAPAGLGSLRGRGLAAVWLDYDGDGRQDLYVANDMEPNFLLRNLGNGAFREAAVEAGAAYGADGMPLSGMGIAAGDYTHEGRDSLLVTNLNGQVYSLFHNTGGGRFAYASDEAGIRLPTMAHSGFGVAFLDFDRDGWLDIVTGNGHVNPDIDGDVPGVSYEEPKSLLRNLGNGTFQSLPVDGALARPRSVRGLAAGDYDNDGRMDLLCVNRNERADLLRNVSGDRNHWLSIRLVGVRSNRDGAGARVLVRAVGPSGVLRQSATCRLQSSYASSPDKRLFYGLGSARDCSVEIRWPSGQRDNFAGVAADMRYVATEGRGMTRDGRS